MSPRTLSIATPLVSLFFFSAFVVAGVNVAANDGPEYGPGASFDPSGVYTTHTSTSSPCAYSATGYSVSVYPTSVYPTSVYPTNVYSPSVYSPSVYPTNIYSTNVYSARPSYTTTPTPSHSKSYAGVIGGVCGSTAIVFVAVGAFLYRRRRRTQAAPPEDCASRPMPNYDANDPTTFPGYQTDARSPDVHPASQVTPYVESGSTQPADMQTSSPNASVYRGLPTLSA